MTLHEFLKIVRQRWIVIVLSTLIAAGVMFAVTPAKRDTTQRIGSYSATATLLVGSRTPSQTENLNPESASLGRVTLFITAGEVPKRAAKTLNYKGDPAVLASGLEVESDPTSQSVTITTTASDGKRAAEVANVFAKEAVKYFKERPEGLGNATLTIMQEATPIPNRSTAGFVIPPDRNIRTGLAAGLGLLFGLALALIMDRLDSRLRTRDEIASAIDLPIIAEVPRLKRSERSNKVILTHTKPLSVYADGYRAARTALTHLSTVTEDPEIGRRIAETPVAGGPKARVVMVTSGHASEGKTTSVANLAASFAETGQRVLVIDADLRNPDANETLDVPQGVGVSDYLSGENVALASLVRPTSIPGVEMITAGTSLARPAALASRMNILLERARRMADVVVVDTAPLLAAADVFDLLPLADAIVVVVRSGRLTANAGHRMAELLGRFQVPVAGAIVIGAPVRKADYGYGYGGYGYGYGQESRRRSAADDSVPVAQPQDETVQRPRRFR